MHSNKLAIIRADASTAIGIGHVMRMLALTQALIKHDWQVHFCFHDCPEKLTKQFAQIGAATRELKVGATDGAALAVIADELGANLVIIDGYQFDSKFMLSLSDCKALVLFMDDHQHCPQYHADIIVNQNVGAQNLHYDCTKPGTRLLLGSDYVLLRPEFIKAHKRLKAQDREFKIVITLGGADSDNVSALLLSATRLALNELSTTTNKSYQVTLVAGAANPHKPGLTEQIESFRSKHCHFEILTDVNDMAELLSQASLVISAGGGTVWEAACLAVANMVVILADNQQGIKKFADLGAIVLLGQSKDLHISEVAQKIIDFVQSSQFAAMPELASRLVDGQGAERIVEVIESF